MAVPESRLADKINHWRKNQGRLFDVDDNLNKAVNSQQKNKKIKQ